MVNNNADRATSLTAEMNEYLATKLRPHSSEETLRGCLFYADCQTVGKLGRFPRAVLSEHIASESSRLSTAAVAALHLEKALLNQSEPRFVH
eukprot:4684315-Amphidinium_carterae.1